MVKVSAPTLIVAVRWEIDVFSATLKLTVPLPEPLVPLVMVTHDTPFVVVQAQPLPALTANDPVPPEAGTVVDPADSENEQVAAAWVIVNVCPPTEMLPLRVDVPVFSATVKVTVPFPDPLDPLVMVIHGAEAVLFQAQPLLDVTSNALLPPAAGAA
jgi:hypothetical protein